MVGILLWCPLNGEWEGWGGGQGAVHLNRVKWVSDCDKCHATLTFFVTLVSVVLSVLILISLFYNSFPSQGKKTNRVACGSAHTIAWSTTKPANAGRLPREVPMEYNHLQSIFLGTLRNRLMLLHHFSDLVCSSLAMFDLQPRLKEHAGQEPLVALDSLRGVLIPSGKVGTEAMGAFHSQNWPARPVDLKMEY